MKFLTPTVLSVKRVGAGPAGVYAVILLIVVLNLLTPPDAPLPFWLPPVASVIYLAAQAIPALRLEAPWISPKNTVLFLGGLQLLVFPTLLQYGVLYRGQLPGVPSRGALAWAVELQIVAFLGMALGLVFLGRAPNGPFALTATPALRYRLLVILGLAGLLIRYPSVDELITYFRGQAVGDDLLAGRTTVLDALSSFLLPALGFGLAVSALEAIRRNHHGFTPYAAVVSVAGVLSGSLLSYNRASVIVPMVVFAAVYTAHLRPMSRWRAIAIAMVVIAAAVFFTELRSEAARNEIRAAGGTVSSFSGYSLGLDELQLYGAAPQFIAIADGTQPARGELVTLNAVMSPVPRLGAPFRAFNGTRTYNSIIYGVGGAVDQTLPTVLELSWDFGRLGVLIGFALIGVGVGGAQRRFIAARTLGEAFAWMFIGCWLAASLILQIETIAQVTIFWSVPALVLLRRTRSAAGA